LVSEDRIVWAAVRTLERLRWSIRRRRRSAEGWKAFMELMAVWPLVEERAQR
jgi:hypothetical protein